MGFANAVPHLHEVLWQDEAVTLMFHVSKGIFGPFLSYGAPNNHIGFTSMLAAWLKLFPNGIDIPMLRALPIILFLLSIPVTAVLGARIAGPLAGVLASLIFATSSVAGNFSTQLRGYGPSWLFMALSLLFAVQSVRTRSGIWPVISYAIFSVFAIAVLPTNVYFLAVQTLAVIAYGCLRSEVTCREGLLRISALLAVLPAGLLLAYAAVWQELMTFSHVLSNNRPRGEIAGAWLAGALWSAPWLAPLAGAGLLSRIGRIQQLGLVRRDAASLMLCLMLFSGFGIAIFVIPGPPFPRSLVPFLPAWSLALGILVTFAVEQVRERRNLAWTAFGLLLFSLPLLAHPAISRCGDQRPDPLGTRYDLCNQYFRDDYKPDQVLDFWISFGRNDLPIVSGYEGFYAIKALGSIAPVFQFERLPSPLLSEPLVVAHDDGEARRIITSLGMQPERYTLARDTGYFNVYAPKER